MRNARKRLIGAVALLVLLSTGCSGQSTTVDVPTTSASQVTVTPTTVPATSPTELPASIESQVPYSRTSVWNTPIGPSPQYDPHSAEMVANLALDHGGKIVTAGENYNYPVYFADGQTPRFDIPCLVNKCTIASSDQDVIRTLEVQNVPIPAGAQPSNDTDARMIIIDRLTGSEYDLWQAQRTATGWAAGNVSRYNILWNGTPVMHSARGSGIPAYAGLLRPWEIRQGEIQHALAFGYTETAADKCVFPASKTDGKSLLPDALPEGARLQLDPSLTDADFDRMGLDAAGKIIARALQVYGMILVDTSGSLKMYVEDLSNNPYAGESWTDPGLNLAKESIYGIPPSAFRVLALPPGYWEPAGNTVYHGKCLAFPTAP